MERAKVGGVRVGNNGGPEGFVITDGKTGDTLINLSDKGITQETKGKVGVQAGYLQSLDNNRNRFQISKN